MWWQHESRVGTVAASHCRTAIEKVFLPSLSLVARSAAKTVTKKKKKHLLPEKSQRKYCRQQ